MLLQTKSTETNTVEMSVVIMMKGMLVQTVPHLTTYGIGTWVCLLEGQFRRLHCAYKRLIAACLKTGFSAVKGRMRTHCVYFFDSRTLLSNKD